MLLINIAMIDTAFDFLKSDKFISVSVYSALNHTLIKLVSSGSPA